MQRYNQTVMPQDPRPAYPAGKQIATHMLHAGRRHTFLALPLHCPPSMPLYGACARHSSLSKQSPYRYKQLLVFPMFAIHCVCQRVCKWNKGTTIFTCHTLLMLSLVQGFVDIIKPCCQFIIVGSALGVLCLLAFTGMKHFLSKHICTQHSEVCVCEESKSWQAALCHYCLSSLHASAQVISRHLQRPPDKANASTASKASSKANASTAETLLFLPTKRYCLLVQEAEPL